jgi:hypothetical protein
VDPADYPRFRELNVTPVLSFQWEKPASDTIDGAVDSLGPRRWPLIEPAGWLAEKGARIAYGSDWPVDPLDEWFALQVGVTRQDRSGAAPKCSGVRGGRPFGGIRRAALTLGHGPCGGEPTPQGAGAVGWRTPHQSPARRPDPDGHRSPIYHQRITRALEEIAQASAERHLASYMTSPLIVRARHRL